LGDVGGASILGDSSYESSVARTTAYFDRAPGRAKEEALGVLLGGSKADTGGGPRRGWHKNWDGNYWINMDPNEQLGFVEGYITCYRRFVPSGTAAFGDSAVTYRDRLTSWYGFDSATGDRNGAREPVPIAEALSRVARDTTDSQR
jgi:hypothetical protein